MHTVESLARLFLRSGTSVRTTKKQGDWLRNLIDRETHGQYRNESIYINDLVIEFIGIQGRSYDFRIKQMN